VLQHADLPSKDASPSLESNDGGSSKPNLAWVVWNVYRYWVEKNE
jgi:hypothetical protein